MKITVKVLPGQGNQCSADFDVSEDTKVFKLKSMVESTLTVPQSLQRLVYMGKTLADESLLSDVGIKEGSKVHLMVKKQEVPVAESSSSSHEVQDTDSSTFFNDLECLLRKHLTSEQTEKVLCEFKKNCQKLVDSMNYEDIEKFAASNFTTF